MEEQTLGGKKPLSVATPLHALDHSLATVQDQKEKNRLVNTADIPLKLSGMAIFTISFS